ncbi:MAG: DUF2851 family protein, partial [Bacteroidia bacterium]|nr:DUF2851 family protein [Bacteroidia bacterium]
MREDFLHFIWQFQHFDKNALATTQQQSLSILDTGKRNADAGADFQMAKVIMDGVAWAGSVEIHLKSSDWNHHQHQQDPSYNNVVLHVVWQDDRPIQRADQSYLPTLELKDRVDMHWLYRYQSLMHNLSPIPCASQWNQVNDLKKITMLDRSLVQRLQDKAFLVRALLIKNQYDWEE